MKRFKILAIAAIGIALCSAFKVENARAARFAGTGWGWVELASNYCDLVQLNVVGPNCDKMNTGPVCTSVLYGGLPAYENSTTCLVKYAPSLLRKP
jgi:hypothetical protein